MEMIFGKRIIPAVTFFLCILFCSCLSSNHVEKDCRNSSYGDGRHVHQNSSHFEKKESFSGKDENLPLCVLVDFNQQWKPVLGGKENGISCMEHRIPGQNVRWMCVKIDLDVRGLEIVAEPSESMNGIVEKMGGHSMDGRTEDDALACENREFFGNSVSCKKASSGKMEFFELKDFAEKNGCFVAVNTVPFAKDGTPSGIVKVDGKVNFPSREKYCALCFKKNPLRAAMVENQDERIDEYDHAFGGFFPILKDGRIFEYKKIRRPRTACGISSGGKFLYLFAVCNENIFAGKKGLTYEECAMILQFLGAEEALQFDGGHSSAMEICGDRVGMYGKRKGLKGVSAEKMFSEEMFLKESLRPFFRRKVPAAIGFRIDVRHGNAGTENQESALK